MQLNDLKVNWKDDKRVIELTKKLCNENGNTLKIRGLAGSSYAFLIYSLSELTQQKIFVIQENKESALYLLNDLETIYDEFAQDLTEKKILFLPTSYKNAYNLSACDNLNILHRSNTIERIVNNSNYNVVVGYPESFLECTIDKTSISDSSFQLSKGESVTMEFMIDVFYSYNFVNVDFVTEPGQFAIRGGIIDVFGYSYDRPYRIEFSDDYILSLRSFDPITQESVEKLNNIKILSNIYKEKSKKKSNIFKLISNSSIFISKNIDLCKEAIEQEWKKFAENDFIKEETYFNREEFLNSEQFLNEISNFKIIELDEYKNNQDIDLDFGIKPHPTIVKNFDFLFNFIKENDKNNFSTIIFSENLEQIKRLTRIIEDIELREATTINDKVSFSKFSLHSGFIDLQQKLAILTDHQIFEKYHRYKFTERHTVNDVMILRDINKIMPGDYIVHIDHGVGQYAGLEKISVNGREQEAIRIVYSNNDLLYVSIHSLHKLSKYSNKEGTVPTLDKIGSTAWLKKKNNAKSKVKDIANDLIKLYSERKSTKGFSCLPDNYLQYELEASFIYEDTEDQIKANNDIKLDMEADYPMDRLVCGDVGFGKTEVAIRAAFKAVLNDKQVAILVPTTILALQHFYTFQERLKDMPVRIEYLNRFRTAKETKKILEDLCIGKIDIIIGTHKLLGKDVEFKDLGLLVIDEEQKFGVSSKERIRQLKVNVDTLILTATPIPRTLQFSLLGARDLSIISTPPTNRYPVHTELINFNHKILAEIIMYEINRGGQVFFVNNRIQNLNEIAAILRKICPNIRIEVGHGQMPGLDLENLITEFIEGKFEVLLSTSIIESGIDIPNANTMIINDAHHYGLSDLHQLRGRVGRSNKRAFCYLITPPLSILSEQSQKRLKAILEFSDLGSGFNISMRDLDIRGAGNLLGAEQSGFISAIGYEMYQKILDEALMEIKSENGYRNEILSKEHIVNSKPCHIETDLSILIPDSYVSNINERLKLYKDLDTLKTDNQLRVFKNNLTDRFGEVPPQTIELLNTVALRLLAQSLDIEKIVLKNKKLTFYFSELSEDFHYESDVYSKLLNWVLNNTSQCIMQKNDKSELYLTVKNVSSISEAYNLLREAIN